MAETIEADFVVIGVGSAGCVMAARLSENLRTKVVLLEAGGADTNPWIHIPLGFGKNFANAAVNWCYETEADPGIGGRKIFWPRGKLLGGSSSINGMVYIRGQKEDFDHWRQLGNAGWSFDDCLPYFRRAEHQTRGHDEYHGTEGPFYVSDVNQNDVICEAFIQNYSAPIKLRSRFPVTVNDVLNSNVSKVKAGIQYVLFRTGALTSGVSPAAMFVRTRPELASPDVKCSISPFSVDRPQDGLHKWSGFTMIAYQLRPKPSGEARKVRGFAPRPHQRHSL